MNVTDSTMEKEFATRSVGKIEKEELDYMKINRETLQLPPAYQKIQLDKGSDDVIYDEISACERTDTAEYELEQTTSEGVYENDFTNPEISGQVIVILNPKGDASTQ